MSQEKSKRIGKAIKTGVSVIRGIIGILSIAFGALMIFAILSAVIPTMFNRCLCCGVFCICCKSLLVVIIKV